MESSAQPVPPVGTCIAKQFGSGWHWGQVVFYFPEERLVHVVYEDGDAEDMEFATAWQLRAYPPRQIRIPKDKLTPTLEERQEGASIHYSLPATVSVSSGSRLSASSSNDSSLADANLRRSGRDKRSTVVYVGKDAVKRDNNYIVRGMQYSYGAFAEDATRPPKVANRKVPNKTSPPKSRIVSPQEKARQQMKMRVEANIAQKQAARRAFLYQHAAVWAPFCPSWSTTMITTKPPAAPPVKQVFMQPDDIKAELRDYQLQGLNFMSAMYQQNISFILGDEMGLGKTVQTLSLVCHLKEKWGASGPSLIVCPLSVLYAWCHELDKWAPSLKYLRFHQSNTEVLGQQCFTAYDVVVTTYEMVNAASLQHLWTRNSFNLVVLDEGHRIKCATTNIAQAVRRLHAECRVILTGTPLANNLTELWALLNFLEPDVFSTSEPFDDAFDLSLNKIDNVKLEQAHQVLNVMMLRRLKDNVEKMLPPKIETRVICPLSTMQIHWYKALLVKDLGLITGERSSKHGLGNLLMQLRKCCQHPFLFDGAEDDPEKTSLQDLIGNSGKLAVLDLLLQSLYKKGHRVTLFSQFTMVLDILDDYCQMRGWEYCRLDGSTPRAWRNHIINSFNAPGSDKFIFLMTTRSGGMGINLQTADTCILFDSDWNPQPDIQAIGRTHRLGQTKKVHIYRLCTLGTVEQRMQERAEKKLYLDRMVMQDGSEPQKMEEGQDRRMLLSTLRFGCNAVFGQAMKKQKLPSLEDIEVLTDRSRSDDYSSGELRGDAGLSADTFDETKEMTSTLAFGGIDFKKIREEYATNKMKDMASIAETWKRERKNRIKMVDGMGSGYGAKAVPVLAANDYDLLTGERSVFDRELNGRTQVQKKKKVQKDFHHQDFCQSCGSGGRLVCCPRCPVSLHLYCAGITSPTQLLSCSHHNCSKCGKTPSAAGGLLYPCTACPNSYCEDDLPSEAIVLEDGCQRMEKLGFNIKNGIYVLCSKQCEQVARKEYGWKPIAKKHARCPAYMGFSSYFGGEVDDVVEGTPNRKRKGVTSAEKRASPKSQKSNPLAPPTTLAGASDEAVADPAHSLLEAPPGNNASRNLAPTVAVAATARPDNNTSCNLAPTFAAVDASIHSLSSAVAAARPGNGANLKAPPVRSESCKENKLNDIIDLTGDD